MFESEFKYKISKESSYGYKMAKNRLARGASSILSNSSRNIYWSKYEPKNFGDWVGPYLYTKYTNSIPTYRPANRFSSTVYTAGSIFRNIGVANSAIVWGSGVISATDQFHPPKEILAVRGRKTYEVLKSKGLKCPKVFGDPAILLSDVYPKVRQNPRYSLGIIPHFKELEFAKKIYADVSDEIVIIDPTLPIESIVNLIVDCDMTLSSSLHGIIVSHTYGVRSGWCRFSIEEALLEGDDIKFYDYFSSFGYDQKVECLKMIPEICSDFSFIKNHVKKSVFPESTSLVDKLKAVRPF